MGGAQFLGNEIAATTFEPGVRIKGIKEVLKIKADNSVSYYFDATATPHSHVDSFYFRQMIKNILQTTDQSKNTKQRIHK